MVGYLGRNPLSLRSRANELNLWEFSLALARASGGEVYDGDDIKWTCTKGPLFNRIFAARMDEDSAAERIGEVVGEFLARGVNVSWITGPSTRPVNLGARLEHCGLAHAVDWAGMDIDLEKIALVDEPKGCRIEEVRDDELLRVWVGTMCEGFGFRENSREAAHRNLSGLSFESESPVRYYLAYMNDVPAAVSMEFHGSETAGVYFVATVPSARRKGFGAAVTLRALEDALSRGFKTAVLQASRSGEHLYSKLGFEHCCTMALYFLDVVNRQR